MVGATFNCPTCRAPLEVLPETTELVGACPQCGADIEAYLLPGFFRPPEFGQSATLATEAGEATCFYHPQKQAAGVCDGCGRLVCALCSIDLGDSHLCPACIASGKKKGKLVTLESRRTRYDNIALALAFAGIPFYYLFFILPAAAIYVAIRHWNSPGSILGVSRIRFVIAIVLAFVSFGLGMMLFGALIIRPFTHPFVPHTYSH
jgi:hypothetical protein